MKRIITICAECKKELKMESLSTIGEPMTSMVINEDVAYSHGICFECGVNLYGGEIMSKVHAKMNVAAASSSILDSKTFQYGIL